MTIEAWLAFVAASVVLLIIPGPTILAVISYSMAHGRRASLPLVAGVALGDSTALAVSLVGLGAILAASSFWFTVAKVCGGLYLLYLGVSLLFTKSSPVAGSSRGLHGSKWRIFGNTYLVTALNPKGIVFFIAFLPQFVSTQADMTLQLTILAMTFVGLATVNAVLYTVFASSIRGLLSSAAAQRRFNRAGGVLLSVAGIWALLARRPA